LFQGRFTAQFFNFLLLLIFPQAVCLDIVIDYCITSQENESRLLVMTNITTIFCDKLVEMARFEDDGKGIDVWLIVTLQNLDLDLESRLDVMLHRFLFSQAESPKGSKTQANSSPFQALERATG
jgi:hypothetical protein